MSQAVITSASTALAVFSLNAAALALRPFTVVRTRGILFGRSDQTAASENWGGAMGIAVVSDQASAVGITALPTPVTDFGSDLWFMLLQQQGRFDLKSAVGVLESGRTVDIESKAMRKVDVGQDIVVVIETTSFNLSWSTSLGFRMLIKLH